MEARKWTEDSIRELLAVSDLAVERAVLAIHARQTADERSSRQTKHRNARGWSAAHDKRGSYYAGWISSGRRLTGRHLAKAREIVLHYAAQLLEVAEAKSTRQAA